MHETVWRTRRAVQTLGELAPEVEKSLDATYGNCLVQSDLEIGRQIVVKHQLLQLYRLSIIHRYD